MPFQSNCNASNFRTAGEKCLELFKAQTNGMCGRDFRCDIGRKPSPGFNVQTPFKLFKVFG